MRFLLVLFTHRVFRILYGIFLFPFVWDEEHVFSLFAQNKSCIEMFTNLNLFSWWPTACSFLNKNFVNNFMFFFLLKNTTKSSDMQCQSSFMKHSQILFFSINSMLWSNLISFQSLIVNFFISSDIGIYHCLVY